MEERVEGLALRGVVHWARFASGALKAAATFWFAVAVAGQLAFAYYIVAFYGRLAAQGNLAGWNRGFPHGHIPGDTVGNAVVAAHLSLAVIVTLGELLQLVPAVRQRAPAFHRWNGRVYAATTASIAVAGSYMTWVRHSVGDISQHVGVTADALLILLFAALAVRKAAARDFRAHRRWALRLFIVASGVWFYRVELMLWELVNGGPAGFDPDTFTGPALTVMSFANYLLPLAVLQLYLRAQARPGAVRRIAVAGALFAATVAMGVGIFEAFTRMWLPHL
jgi:hypothetical protein